MAIVGQVAGHSCESLGGHVAGPTVLDASHNPMRNSTRLAGQSCWPPHSMFRQPFPGMPALQATFEMLLWMCVCGGGERRREEKKERREERE